MPPRVDGDRGPALHPRRRRSPLSARWDGGVGDDAGAPSACPDGRSLRELFEDADGDGYGRVGSGEMGCEGTPGRVTRGGDCDDTCRDCYPGAVEICDGRDNDCASGPDDTFACVRGAATECETSCGSTGVVACGLDCAVAAGATCTAPEETCNGADDDCDGITDEGVLSFGEPVEWPMVENAFGLWAPAPTGDEMIVPFLRPAGLYVARVNDNGTVLAESDLLTEGDFPTVAVSWTGDVIHVAYARQEASSASLELMELEPTTLAPRGPAAVVRSLNEPPTRIDFVPALTTTLVYDDRRDLETSSLLLSGSGYSHRLLVSNVDGPHDVIASAATAGAAFVLYATTPDPSDPEPSTESEIFLQQLRGASAAGPPLRITRNSVPDVIPHGYFRDGVLGATWWRSDSVSSFEGAVYAALVQVDVQRVSEPIRLGASGVLAQPRIARHGSGWLVRWSDVSLDRAGPFIAAPLDAALGTVGITFRTTDERAWFSTLYGSHRVRGTDLWWSVAVATGEDSLEFRALSVGCRE